MSTGTAKDPFEDVKRPVCGEFVEIGQPTFAELIWAREVLTRATSGPDPDVGAALRILAYGKSPIELPEMRQPGTFQAIPPPGANGTTTSAKYSVNGKNTAKSYKDKVKGLGMAKSSVDFYNLIVNDTDLVPGSLASQILLSPQADNCAMISGNNAPEISPSGCPESDCNVDAIFAIDRSGSMSGAIAGVKTGAAEMANLINSVSGGSYRFALNTFCCGTAANPFETVIPLTTTNCGNITQFQNAVNGISLAGGYEPWDLVIRDVSLNTGTDWTFRSNSDARVLFIITDEAESYIDGPSASNWATELGRCGVRIAFVWTSSQNPYTLTRSNFGAFGNLGNLLDDITEKTDGIWIQAPGGANIAPLMTSFILSVCASEPRIPECPGGEDKILNGKFETSVANWNDVSTLPGRQMLWNSGYQNMELNGAASQSVSGLTPGDLAILSLDVFVDTAPAAAAKAMLLEARDALPTAQEVSEQSQEAKFAKYNPIFSPKIVNPDQDPEAGFPAVCKLGQAGQAPVSIDQSTYDGKSFTPPEATPTDLFLNNTRSKLWVIGDTGNTVNQFTLSTPGDISTATLDPESFTPSGGGDLRGLHFNASQSKMWLTKGSRVYEYNLTTPGDVSTATEVASKNISPDVGGSGGTGLFVNTAATKMWVMNLSGRIYQYTIAGNISTAVLETTYDIAEDSAPLGFFLNSDGGTQTKFFVAGTSSNNVYQYTLSTPTDISTTNYDNKSVSIGGAGAVKALHLKSDDSAMWVIRGDTIYQYTIPNIDYYCTGSLIHPRFVLTAAHCVDGGIPDGELRFDFGGTVYKSQKININPDWNPVLINTDDAYDIAVIELTEEVVGITPLGISSIRIAPEGMSPNGPEANVGSPIKLVGFGRTGGDAGGVGGTYGTKRSGDQIVTELTTQLLRYAFTFSGDASASRGDSGGPVLFQSGGTYYISGVVSGGTTPTGELGTTVFNTRVSEFDRYIYDIVDPSGAEATNKLRYELRDGDTNVLASGVVTQNDLVPVGQENAQRFDLTATIKLDGIIEVFFTTEDGDDLPFFIDNVLLCVLKEDDCGPGTRNLILNPNFETGVDFWDDATNTAITPTNDPDVWDDLLNAIIISLTGEPEVRTTVIDLTPGRNYSLNFELTSFEPEVVASLEFIYGVLDSSNNVIQQATITRGASSPPQRLQIDFVAPPDGTVRVFFKGGVTSGVAKVRNVLLCDPSGTCDDGFSKISFDDFETGRGAWAGGTHDLIEQYIVLDADGGDDTLTQTFTSLEPGSTLQLTFNVLNNPGGVGIFRVEFHSGGIIDQFNTGGTPGIKTYSTIVQDDGIVTIFIKNLSTFDAALDDVLVCQQDAPPCDGSITDLEVLIEWDGIPRKPTNLFNAIVRYTIRDPDDPFDVTTITQIPTSEGVLGLASCDTWKQQGQGGNPQNGILAFGLTPSLAATIDTGDFYSVATRTNWIWSIPDTGGIQDTLTISFPPPPPGLIESVEVFLLANHVTPSGADSAPVNPPPLLCDPDPASELTVSVRYKNSKRLQREFTQRINKNNVWQQNADFTIGTPWDTVSAFNNGIKGSSARWESFEFVLDDVDGKGLDQCTTPLFFVATGQGTLTFSEFAFQNGRGVFTDSCLAEILVTNLTPGSSTNEVQSIILPTPSGGTWTLQFDFGGQAPVTAQIQWNATAAQVQGALTALPNIGTGNVSVTGSGTQVDPFLVEFIGTLGARDHNLLVGDGSNLTGSSTAFVQTVVNGTTNERQTISRNNDTVFADLLITFGGQTTVPLSFNRSLNEAQSALEGLSSIGAGNVLVTGDVTDRDAAYAGPLRIDFIGSLGSQNVGLMSVEPSTQYTVVQDWMGGPAPTGGVDENQLVTVQAFGGTYTLRVYDVGSTVPAINVQTTTNGGTSNNDIYDIEFDGTLSGVNISPINYDGDIGAGVTAAGSTTQNGDNTGTNPVNEIQRITFSWTPGGVFNAGSVGLQSPTDSNLSDLVGDRHLIQRGVDSSAAIKSYLESAAAVTAGDITVVNAQLYGTLDEVQTFTITGNPISGTFALTLEGETTTDIPYDATAEQVALALNALPNVSGGITVTSSGTLPGDVTYTVTFGGADSGKDWAQLIADARNLVGNAVFADTAAIAYNAPASDVKNAIVTAASWLSNADINVTKVADTPDDTHLWNVVWTGAYARADIPQMLADGSLLTGAPIIIAEVTSGSGNNERQRLQIIRATGGSFRIVLTINGVRESTSPIPWNTTAAGLEAQLLQLSFFEPGQISVVDEYPGGRPPDPINASFIVVFQRIFGDVPLMEPKFQETLLCNPVVLPPIDPGPYPYPLPDCDDLNDISCQSGPLLCKPGEGDDPIPEIDCCDNETITSTANYSKRLQIERDLFDPNRKVNGQRMTLRDLALIKGLDIGEYTPYERNWNLGTLTETTWSRVVETKLSFVLIENDLDSRRGRQRVLSHLAKHREILPARFVWPEVEFTQP